MDTVTVTHFAIGGGRRTSVREFYVGRRPVVPPAGGLVKAFLSSFGNYFPISLVDHIPHHLLLGRRGKKQYPTTNPHTSIRITGLYFPPGELVS